MKISASTYSFAQYIDSGRLTQLSCIAQARDMGFDGIDLVEIWPHDGSTEIEYAKKLGEEARRLDMPIVNYAFGANFISGSGGDRTAEIERVKRQIDIAALLGAESVRHDAGYGWPMPYCRYRGFDDALPIMADACRAVTEYAASLGIRTMVENHGHFCQDSERLEKIVRTVAHENFGLLVDMGNFLCVDENPVQAVSRVAPYAVHVHVKDMHIKYGHETDPGEGFSRTRGGNYVRGAIVGHGTVPVKTCLKALCMAGYDGFAAIEFEGMEDALTGLRVGLANLRRYIAETLDSY